MKNVFLSSLEQSQPQPKLHQNFPFKKLRKLQIFVLAVVALTEITGILKARTRNALDTDRMK